MILPLVMYFITAAPVFAAEENFRSVYTTSRQNKHLAGKAVKNIDTPGLMSCSQSCLNTLGALRQTLKSLLARAVKVIVN